MPEPSPPLVNCIQHCNYELPAQQINVRMAWLSVAGNEWRGVDWPAWDIYLKFVGGSRAGAPSPDIKTTR